MFSRGDRFTTVAKDLPPRSYNLASSYKPKACHVPFNCSAPAHALADNNVPAPCTYNVTFRKRRVQGCASLRFTEPRVTFKNKVIPSPLSYDPDFVYRRPPKTTPKGVICRGKPPRYGNVPAISIPYKYFNGFDVVSGNYLVKRPPAEDFTKPIVPIYYSFPFEVNNVTLTYKGNHWSKLKSQRKPLLAGNPDSPGICTYDLLDKMPTDFDKYVDRIKFYNRANMISLRFLDMNERRLLTLNEPGPGYYEVQERTIRSVTFPKSSEKVYYEDNRKLYDNRNFDKQISHHKKWPPFNSSCKSRPSFVKDPEISPADYLIWNHSVVYNCAKDLYFPRVVYPFNSSLERNCAIGSFSSCNPEPWKYDIKRFPDKHSVNIFGKKDKNSYLRPMKLSPIFKVCPKEVAPWSYEVDSSFYLLSRKRDFHKGALWLREKCDRAKWMVDLRSPDVFYTYNDVGARKVFHHKFGAPFIKRNLDETPGPADYNVHPLYREGLVKAHFTFNASKGIWRPGKRSPKVPKFFEKNKQGLPWPHSLIFNLVNELFYD